MIPKLYFIPTIKYPYFRVFYLIWMWLFDMIPDKTGFMGVSIKCDLGIIPKKKSTNVCIEHI